MRHTLREFLEHYNPQYIQLLIGGHLISIDTNIEGSYFIIKAFENKTFTLDTVKDNLIILTTNY